MFYVIRRQDQSKMCSSSTYSILVNSTCFSLNVLSVCAGAWMRQRVNNGDNDMIEMEIHCTCQRSAGLSSTSFSVSFNSKSLLEDIWLCPLCCLICIQLLHPTRLHRFVTFTIHLQPLLLFLCSSLSPFPRFLIRVDALDDLCTSNISNFIKCVSMQLSPTSAKVIIVKLSLSFQSLNDPITVQVTYFFFHISEFFSSILRAVVAPRQTPTCCGPIHSFRSLMSTLNNIHQRNICGIPLNETPQSEALMATVSCTWKELIKLIADLSHVVKLHISHFTFKVSFNKNIYLCNVGIFSL